MYRRALGPLSPPPSAFTAAAVLAFDGATAELRCDFERQGGSVVGGLRFEQVVATRYTTESLCTPWHVEGAYDQLVEVMESDWLEQLDPSRRGNLYEPLHHFLVYVDDFGAYEFAASRVAWLK